MAPNGLAARSQALPGPAEARTSSSLPSAASLSSLPDSLSSSSACLSSDMAAAS